MRLTGKRSNNAKRARQFVDFMKTYFNISENEANESITKIAPIVRYFKCKNIYLTKNGNEIEVDTLYNPNICNILLDVYIDNEAIYCQDYITLLFPENS